ncbi:ABC transporter permease [Paenibacillus eucommiae]|uniref:Aldouronate transport system permease protein n=1 Tax=Paenibacillus eucommiae TaxID=1355755 RepID=A0ABS4IXV8_9BACL|nr:ABC transporter permease subunit [Paenibacillus eucommiae]MBP1991721.1 putative aldouronate transport system permease protein [Paenibacillus eucommiae]
MHSKTTISGHGVLPPAPKKRYFAEMRKYKFLYLLVAPGLLYFLVFHYIPMYGVIIAFQDFKPFSSISSIWINPNWVGLEHFRNFFNSYYFGRLLQNTLLISIYKIIFGFPAPILLALLLNEVRQMRFKKIVQTISYLPHFLSWVIISGMVIAVLSPTTGAVNWLIEMFGGKSISFLSETSYFRSVLVSSEVWATIGWGSIIYIAALAGIDPAQYESVKMDGANRLQQMIYISLPGMANIISILLVLTVGGILNAGFEQVLLLYSPKVYSVGDIIDTYVYREGLINNKYSYAQAIGMFKNVIGLFFVLATNIIVKRLGREGIW